MTGMMLMTKCCCEVPGGPCPFTCPACPRALGDYVATCSGLSIVMLPGWGPPEGEACLAGIGGVLPLIGHPDGQSCVWSTQVNDVVCVCHHPEMKGCELGDMTDEGHWRITVGFAVMCAGMDGPNSWKLQVGIVIAQKLQQPGAIKWANVTGNYLKSNIWDCPNVGGYTYHSQLNGDAWISVTGNASLAFG